MPNSYIKKKALEFKKDDSEKIIRYRKRLVKALNVETSLLVMMGFVQVIAFFISLICLT